MIDNRTWILIADAAGARIFEKPRDRNHIEGAPKHTMTGTQLRNGDIQSDRAGRTFDSVGEGRHSKEPKVDPTRYEKSLFAHAVAQRLEDEKMLNAFDHIILVAPPQFLGDLRKSLSSSVKPCVIGEVAKDLTNLPVLKIDDHLGAVLRPYEH